MDNDNGSVLVYWEPVYRIYVNLMFIIIIKNKNKKEIDKI